MTKLYQYQHYIVVDELVAHQLVDFLRYSKRWCRNSDYLLVMTHQHVWMESIFGDSCGYPSWRFFLAHTKPVYLLSIYFFWRWVRNYFWEFLYKFDGFAWTLTLILFIFCLENWIFQVDISNQRVHFTIVYTCHSHFFFTSSIPNEYFNLGKPDETEILLILHTVVIKLLISFQRPNGFFDVTNSQIHNLMPLFCHWHHNSICESDFAVTCNQL